MPRRPTSRAPRRSTKAPADFPELVSRRHEYRIPGLEPDILRVSLDHLTYFTGLPESLLTRMARLYPHAFCRVLEMDTWAVVPAGIAHEDPEAAGATVERVATAVEGLERSGRNRLDAMHALAEVALDFLRHSRLQGLVDSLERHSHALPPIEAVLGRNMEVPVWLVGQCLALLFDSVYPQVRRRTGRLARDASAFEQDRTDAARFCAACLIHDMARTSWESAFSAAAAYLDGSYASGSEENVRRSYLRFRKRPGGAPSAPDLAAPLVAMSLERLLRGRPGPSA